MRTGAAYKQTDSVDVAAVTGAVCPQNFAILNFMPVPVPVPQLVSEDCLFLNIWTPTLEKNANLPVMFFIHGGSFISGAYTFTHLYVHTVQIFIFGL